MENTFLNKIILFFLSIFFSHGVISKPVTEQVTYQTCFTPGQECTKLIIDTLYSAKTSVYVQAASFTSTPIAKAIVNAKQRGLDVIVILDKSQIKENRYSLSSYFINNNVPVYIDYKLAIAHNKVIIIDKKVVITGSFNFTKAAQYWNAENVLIISNPELATRYFNNWQTRFKDSVKAQDFHQVFKTDR